MSPPAGLAPADAEQVEPVRAGLERADDRGRDAQHVPGLELDDLVVELRATGARDDDVGLLLLAVAVAERHARARVVGEAADAELGRAQRAARELPLHRRVRRALVLEPPEVRLLPVRHAASRTGSSRSVRCRPVPARLPPAIAAATLPAPTASPAANTPGTDVAPNRSATARPVPLGESVVSRPSEAARPSRGSIGAHVERVDRQLVAVGEADEPRRDGGDRPLVDRDAAGVQRVAVLGRQGAVAEHDEVLAPRAQQRHPVRHAGRAEDADPLVTVLPAVAVRAHEAPSAPQLGEARRVRHDVAHTAGQQDAPAC